MSSEDIKTKAVIATLGEMGLLISVEFRDVKV